MAPGSVGERKGGCGERAECHEDGKGGWEVRDISCLTCMCWS